MKKKSVSINIDAKVTAEIAREVVKEMSKLLKNQKEIYVPDLLAATKEHLAPTDKTETVRGGRSTAATKIMQDIPQGENYIIQLIAKDVHTGMTIQKASLKVTGQKHWLYSRQSRRKQFKRALLDLQRQKK